MLTARAHRKVGLAQSTHILISLAMIVWSLLVGMEVAAAEVLDEIKSIQRVDGSKLNLFISRPNVSTKVPIVLLIDGSGCYSAHWTVSRSGVELPDTIKGSAASLIVDKPGLEPGQGNSANCPQEFLQRYSIDNRAADHLRAFQYLRKHASSWWNGEIYLSGYSDGAMIGVLVASYSTEVKRAVFGGFGGGISMARSFEDFMLCQPLDSPDRDKCLAETRKLFDEMRANPTGTKTWSGGANSYKVWASRLDNLEQILLQDLTIPFLIVHGQDDRDSSPVQSARALIKSLETSAGVKFDYWEVPHLAHTFNGIPPTRAKLLHAAMINWLLEKPVGEGGPPTFGLKTLAEQ